MKIFCIGMNKTCTTSLKAALTDLGLTTPHQVFQQKTLYHLLKVGDFTRIKAFLHDWDFFQDMPFSMGCFFAQLDCMYPNAKFILTIRDTEDWWKSFTRSHIEMWRHYVDQEILLSEITSSSMLKSDYVTPGFEANNHRIHWLSCIKNNRISANWANLYVKEHYCKLYENRNQMIIQNFATRQDKLLILDITKEKSNQRLLDFLTMSDIKPKPFSRTNVTFNKSG